MLYRPGDFEPLTDEPWAEKRIRAGIQEIVVDVETALGEPKLLGAPTTGTAAGRQRARSRTSTQEPRECSGRSPIWWSAHAEARLDLRALALGTLDRYRRHPDLVHAARAPEPRESLLLCGETGVLLVAYRLAPSPETADALLARVRGNAASEANELLWGIPGTLVAARHMLGWTGDERWRSAWDESASALLERREEDGTWTQRLYGDVFRALHPAHGLTGNVLALRQLLPEAPRARLERETAAVLARTAVVEDGVVNWPPSLYQPLVHRTGQIRAQWCHGSPGIVASARSYLDEELLLAGAELTWRAGAHGDEKGSSICHGTAGNGYALLAAFERTDDERWLERARRFAVHALAQCRRQPDVGGTASGPVTSV